MRGRAATPRSLRAAGHRPAGRGWGPRSVVMPDVRGPPRAGGGALGRGGPRFAPYARSSGPTPLSGRGVGRVPVIYGVQLAQPLVGRGRGRTWPGRRAGGKGAPAPNGPAAQRRPRRYGAGRSRYSSTPPRSSGFTPRLASIRSRSGPMLFFSATTAVTPFASTNRRSSAA